MNYEKFSLFHIKFITSYWLTLFVSKKKKRAIMSLDYPNNAKEGDHYKLSGSFFLVRVSDFIKCGMMDPATFLYCEEEINDNTLSSAFTSGSAQDLTQDLKQEQWHSPDVPLFLLYHRNRYQPARLKVLIDFICQKFTQL